MTEQENDVRLSALLQGTVDDVRGRLSDLSAPDLERLADLEEEGKNRKGVLDTIGEVLVALADGAAQTEMDDTDPEVTEQNTDQEQDEAGADDAAAAAGADTDVDTDVLNPEPVPAVVQQETDKNDSGKAARGEECPPWQKPEYSGGLTGEQALWRKANLITK